MNDVDSNNLRPAPFSQLPIRVQDHYCYKTMPTSKQVTKYLTIHPPLLRSQLEASFATLNVQHAMPAIPEISLELPMPQC